MTPDHLNARCAFYDGPVTVFVHEGPAIQIMEAYERLGRLVRIAACTMENDRKEQRRKEALDAPHG